MSYLGIIIEQSLKDNSIIREYELLAEKQVGTWRLLLISIPDNEINDQMKKLQKHMIDIAEDCWYAHFFKDETLFVVYQDVIFQTSVSQEDWNEVIQHGLNNGIPIEQLDFNPRTADAAFTLFNCPSIYP